MLYHTLNTQIWALWHFYLQIASTSPPFWMLIMQRIHISVIILMQLYHDMMWYDMICNVSSISTVLRFIGSYWPIYNMVNVNNWHVMSYYEELWKITVKGSIWCGRATHMAPVKHELRLVLPVTHPRMQFHLQSTVQVLCSTKSRYRTVPFFKTPELIFIVRACSELVYSTFGYKL